MILQPDWSEGLLSVLFIAIASVLNAVMDRIGDKVSYDESVFKHLDPDFWSKDISWKKVKPIFKYHPDAWHLSKSFMLSFILLAACLYSPILGGVFDFLIFGIVWNLTFNLFYNKILVD